MPKEPVPEESTKTRRTFAISTLTVAWIVSGLGGAYLIWTTATGPLPHPALHDAVTTTLGVGIVVGWLWHVATSAAAQRRADMGQVIDRVEALITETELHRAAAQSRLHAAVVDALENRSDIPTERILTVVAEATTQVREELATMRDSLDGRLVVVEVALSTQVDEIRRNSYSSGYVTGVRKRLAGRSEN